MKNLTLLLWIVAASLAIVHPFSVPPKSISVDGYATIRKLGLCYNRSTHVQFEVNSNPLYTVCHNETYDFTYWAKHTLHGHLLSSAENGGPRPRDFSEGGFFPLIDAQRCYSGARKTVGELLNSTALADKYLPPSPSDLFLARGHLVPNGDPIKKAEKNATFYFLNTSPQWQSINGGNWETLESRLRNISRDHNATFEIWTGSYGIMKLKDVKQVPTEIWLGRGFGGNLLNKLPVHHLTWKVIHYPEAQTGVAIVIINNPWLEHVTADDILCESVCDKLSWVSWDTTNITAGYTYCCTLSSFRAAVDYAPDLGELPLLEFKSPPPPPGGDHLSVGIITTTLNGLLIGGLVLISCFML